MYTLRTIAKDTFYVGASDRRLAKFENLFPIPRGVSYNSYVICDQHTALLDTADASVSARFLSHVQAALAGRPLDYLIINHMEPDHTASLAQVLLLWPKVRLVCNAKTVPMLQAYLPANEPHIADALVVTESDVLCLGAHTLHFVMAPMVHWPEVMMTFDEATGVLFSADAFGTFGALSGNLFADEMDFARDWLEDARRYYANIVGKYGAMVQAVLKKAASLPIQTLAPLHGPIWRTNLGWFLEKYDRWSRWQPESNAVVLFYGSMYGNTEALTDALADRLAARGITGLAEYDISVTDTSTLVAEAFRASHLVLACPTYNGALYLPMETLLNDLKALGLSGRTVALLENGSWAPAAGRLMQQHLSEWKQTTLLAPTVTQKGAAVDDSALDALADAIATSLAQASAT